MVSTTRLIATSLAAATFGAALGITGSAFAGTARSEVKSVGSVNGYNYENYSTVYTNESGFNDAHSSTTVRTAGGATVPAGYMGVRTELIKGGVSCHIAGPRYTDGRTNTFTLYYFDTDCGTGSYQALGNSYVRKADGTYKSTLTAISPFQSQTR